MADYKANSSEYKPQTVDYQNSPQTNGVPPGKKPGKIKAHFRRFWWLHLLNFIIGTLLLSLLLTYVGLPNIAQHDVNKADLIISAQVVTKPTPNSVFLDLNTTAKSYSLFRPTLDAFDVDLFLEDTEPDIKPFGRITIPSLHATKETNTTISQEMQILNNEQFNRYNTRVTQAESFRVAMRGKTKLHLGALPVVTVNFNKAAEMKGLNSLKDIVVTVNNITLAGAMSGTINIPNPSVMTLTIGDVIQDVFMQDGTKLGNATIKNVILKPGNDNNFELVGQNDIKVALPAIATGGGKLSIVAKTTGVIYNGQHLTYYETAMGATPVSTSLDLTKALAGIGITLPAPGSNSTTSTTPTSASAAPSSSSTAART